MGAEVSRHATAELPDELFALIIAKLPLSYIFQLRLVCRKWNAIFRNTRFLQQYSHLPGLAPLYFWPSSKGKKYATYNFENNSWHMLPMRFISMRSSWNLVHGGANGCVLVSAREGSESAAYLVNPMTRSYEKLPKSLMESVVLIMIYDENSKSYKIFAEKFREHHCGPMSFWMYDTVLQAWTNFGDWGGRRMRYGLPTIHRGVLHCLVTERDAKPEVWKVFRCEDGQSLHQLTAAQFPCNLLFVHMFEWKGNLVLIGGKSMKHKERCLASVEVWQLNEEKNVWMEGMRMPDDLLLRFSVSKPMRYGSVQVYNNGDHVFLSCWPCSKFVNSSFAPSRSVEVISYRFVKLIICNLSNSTWWEAPELVTSGQQRRLLGAFGSIGFALKPNFGETFGNIVV